MCEVQKICFIRVFDLGDDQVFLVIRLDTDQGEQWSERAPGTTVYQSGCTVQVLFSYHVEDRYAHDRTICILLNWVQFARSTKSGRAPLRVRQNKTNAHHVNRTRI